MIHLRSIVPDGRTGEVVAGLTDNPGVTNLVVLPGAAKDPAGDLVLCDVAREAADGVIEDLKRLGLGADGSISMDQVELTISESAEEARRRAPGHGDDAVIWDHLHRGLSESTRPTWTFFAFLILATQLAGIAALLDSPILIVGAMVLGPEFGPIAAISSGLLFRRWTEVGRAAGILVVGFAAAVAVTFACAWAGDLLGIVDVSELPKERPLTGFVYSPDRWSFIVAVLAGAAGVLSLTSDKSSSLVGVFISVTTVPAAGNLAVALALGHESEIRGSVLQLLVNILGMIIAGTATLLVQWCGTRLLLKRTGRRSHGG
ncbi:DUF389 domain-containing protein [Actinocorallia sp. B10E7]|uniref:DUF389 domain-containing protein n=1 Tax=Actinocorallia sp. B10E7 TaxID=3153558 RepID=UPI00325D1054